MMIGWCGCVLFYYFRVFVDVYVVCVVVIC